MGVEEYRKKLAERAKRNRKAFKGLYKNELKALLGLSRADIDKITPGSKDMEVYAQLITIVKEASADNIDQAELKDRIQELGKVGIAIAKRVPALLDLLT